MVCSEVAGLLQEIGDSKAALAEANGVIDAKEKEMAKMQELVRYQCRCLVNCDSLHVRRREVWGRRGTPPVAVAPSESRSSRSGQSSRPPQPSGWRLWRRCWTPRCPRHSFWPASTSCRASWPTGSPSHRSSSSRSSCCFNHASPGHQQAAVPGVQAQAGLPHGRLLIHFFLIWPIGSGPRGFHH